LCKWKVIWAKFILYPFPLKKKNCIYQFQGENLFTNLLSKFERNLHNSKFDAITAIAPLHWVAKLVQIYFFILCNQIKSPDCSIFSHSIYNADEKNKIKFYIIKNSYFQRRRLGILYQWNSTLVTEPSC
jgi:hypothetical protein